MISTLLAIGKPYRQPLTWLPIWFSYLPNYLSQDITPTTPNDMLLILIVVFMLHNRIVTSVLTVNGARTAEIH